MNKVFLLILSVFSLFVFINSTYAIFQWHPAGEIYPGIFGYNLTIGNYTFPADLTVDNNAYVLRDLGVGTTSPATTLDVNGATTVRGNLDVQSNRIENVANPTASTDALNLGYAEARYVNTAGDTMTGDLSMGGHKVTNLVMTDSHGTSSESANQNYVDWKSGTDVNTSVSGTSGYVAKFTGAHALGNSIIYDNGKVGIGTSGPATTLDVNGATTVRGNLDVQSNRIENVANPTASTDAINLGYADARYVNTAGDTMTGDLNLGGHSISGVNQLTASKFVDRDNSGYYVDPSSTSKVNKMWVTSDLLIQGKISNVNVQNLNTNGSLIPTLDNSFDVGNSTNRWRNGYFSNNVSVGSNIQDSAGANRVTFSGTNVIITVG